MDFNDVEHLRQAESGHFFAYSCKTTEQLRWGDLTKSKKIVPVSLKGPNEKNANALQGCNCWAIGLLDTSLDWRWAKNAPIQYTDFVGTDGKGKDNKLDLIANTLAKLSQSLEDVRRFVGKSGDTDRKGNPPIKIVPNLIYRNFYHASYHPGPDLSVLPGDGGIALEDTGFDFANPNAGQGVLVAILDTASSFEGLGVLGRTILSGIDLIEPLRPGIRDTFDSNTIARMEQAHGLDIHRTSPALPPTQEYPINHGTGHGYPIASLIRKVAPQAILLPIRVCDDHGLCEELNVLNGICQAISISEQRRSSLVLNLSLGSFTPSEAMRDILTFANTKGVSVAVAAGNWHPDTQVEFFNDSRSYRVGYPAGFGRSPGNPSGLQNIVGVGSLKAKDINQVADQSLRGTHVAIAAPGYNIQATSPSGRPEAYTGTSYATPIVSGVLASIKSIAAINVSACLFANTAIHPRPALEVGNGNVVRTAVSCP
jgi:hypothetical protein